MGRRIASVALVVSAAQVGGCGTFGKTTALVLAGTGLAATATGSVLAFGCEHVVQQEPRTTRRGSCLPDDRAEAAAPYVYTSIVAGIVLIAAGVAVAEASDPKPAVARGAPAVTHPKPTTPTPSTPSSDEWPAY